jgi:hypothetical protein
VNNELLEKIKSRGHWQILIRPTTFSEERIPTLHECQQLVEQYQVRLRGWYFPHLEPQAPQRRLDYIEQGATFRCINEIWRFYQSGQFVFFRSLDEDWLKESPGLLGRSEPPPEPGSVLDTLGILYQLSEAYEFATRLAQQGVFGDSLLLKVSLVGMNDRLLGSWNAREILAWGLERGYKCHAPELTWERTFDVGDLVARPQEHSFKHFLWVMDRFGFDAPDTIFKREQERFLERRS